MMGREVGEEEKFLNPLRRPQSLHAKIPQRNEFSFSLSFCTPQSELVRVRADVEVLLVSRK